LSEHVERLPNVPIHFSDVKVRLPYWKILHLQ